MAKLNVDLRSLVAPIFVDKVLHLHQGTSTHAGVLAPLLAISSQII